jgi:hypothetical protein
MLTYALKAQVKRLNIETFYWKLCILNDITKKKYDIDNYKISKLGYSYVISMGYLSP